MACGAARQQNPAPVDPARGFSSLADFQIRRASEAKKALPGAIS
jgi:hypothetical protein